MKGKRKFALLCLAFSSFILASCGSQGVPGEIGPIGPQGPAGHDGADGENGKPGIDGQDGEPGQNGEDGLSAYEIYKKYHPDYTKSEKEWIEDVVSGNLIVNNVAKVTFIVKDSIYKHQIVRKGYNIVEPEKPKLESNETFVGWFYEDKEWFFAGYSISNDITLTAKITKSETAEPEPDNGEEVEPPKPQDPTDLKSYDPFYPEQFTDTKYKLVVPDFNERLILNEDKTVATLFAPHISKTNFYDANKNFRNDMYLCWAGTSSNLIAWYLNELSLLGVDLTGVQRDPNKIFDNFRECWDPYEGYDFMQGVAWYFTGKTLDGKQPPELLVGNSGGFLTHLPNVGDQWSILDAANHYPIVGNYQLQYPFLDDDLSVQGTYENFSKKIVGQLHYGPCALTIGKPNVGATGSHAITLWGCDFDTKTGLVKKIYVSDSDDEFRNPGKHMQEVNIFRETDGHGIKMQPYYLNNSDPYYYIGCSMGFLSPSAINF